MGKMNLLHIACDSGWWQLAGELVEVESMDANLACPSPNMRPGNLTPLMLASGQLRANYPHLSYHYFGSLRICAFCLVPDLGVDSCSVSKYIVFGSGS